MNLPFMDVYVSWRVAVCDDDDEDDAFSNRLPTVLSEPQAAVEKRSQSLCHDQLE